VEFTLYRDLTSIRPIRCTSKIDGSENLAEGTAFLAGKAIEKCRSERIEREFQIRNRIYPLGIAAHRNARASKGNAYREALETMLLKKIASAGVIHGVLLFRFSRIGVYCTRINDSWFTLLKGEHKETPIYTYAARRTILSSILQSWTEYRNIKFYDVDRRDLLTYSKANLLFSSKPLEFKFSLTREKISLDRTHAVTVPVGEHFVTYIQEGEEK
jgi:hypothetical protein